MKTLKWFKQNLCTYEEFTAKTTPEAKIISGNELFHQLNRLALMEAYMYMRSWRKYVYDPLVKHLADRIYKAYIRNQIYTNVFYKIRLKDGMSLEEYGLKAIHFEPAYPVKSPRKHRKENLYMSDKFPVNGIDTIYRFLTKNSLNHNEFIYLAKILRSNKLKYEFNCYYRCYAAIIPGKYFIRGKEFTEIQILIPDLSEIRADVYLKHFEIKRCERYPYAENVYTINDLRRNFTFKRPFEMGRGKWMLSSENCWA